MQTIICTWCETEQIETEDNQVFECSGCGSNKNLMEKEPQSD